jgi:hypothetical protein
MGGYLTIRQRYGMIVSKTETCIVKRLDQSGLASSGDESEIVSGQIHKKIEVPIERLEFRFSNIAFRDIIADFNREELNLK